MTQSEYIEQIKSAFFTIAKKTIMAEFAKDLPVAFFNFANPIIGLFVDKILNIIITNGETAAFFKYIDMRVGQQSGDFEQSLGEYHAIKQTGTPEQIRAAEERLISTFRNFVKLTN